MVTHSFKVSPSARCVSAANASCKDIDIFKKGYISLTDIFITLLVHDFLLCPYSVGFIL
jgi:hypothetical protein